MKKIAVIDIGSNSVRLMVVADGKVLYKTLEITRLGEGLAVSGVLSPQALERTAATVARFYNQAVAEGVQKVVAFATAAARSAKNGSAFVARVAELCPITVDVISGEEEAEIGILGALGNADGGIIDVGGASTEIILREGGEIVYKKSVDVGVVRLMDGCGRNVEKLKGYSLQAVKAFGTVSARALCAIGGTATSIASIALQQKTYDGQAVTGFAVTKEILAQVTDYLTETPVERVVAETCVPEKRAEVLLGGAVWLGTVMAELGVEKLLVSDADNLEGYAVKHGYLG